MVANRPLGALKTAERLWILRENQKGVSADPGALGEARAGYSGSTARNPFLGHTLLLDW